ncbi:hypothetical protein [Candidatus Sororendozoicomonas aggregata]|uniref:hypothetical protein n=1 Tax=Candidatus Sororendozoicomonas aggregata TaxID=3073239 RepID=UPI002ED2A683
MLQVCMNTVPFVKGSLSKVYTKVIPMKTGTHCRYGRYEFLPALAVRSVGLGGRESSDLSCTVLL